MSLRSWWAKRKARKLEEAAVAASWAQSNHYRKRYAPQGAGASSSDLFTLALISSDTGDCGSDSGGDCGGD